MKTKNHPLFSFLSGFSTFDTRMEDRNSVDLTNLCVDRWNFCEGCVIHNPSCLDCRKLELAQYFDRSDIQRARIHKNETINLTEEEEELFWEEVEAQELFEADAELDDDDDDDEQGLGSSDDDDQSVRVMTEEEVQNDPRMSREAARANLRVDPPEGEHDVVLLDNRYEFEGWDTPKEMFHMMRKNGLHTCKHFAGACIPCAFKVNKMPELFVRPPWARDKPL